MYNTLLHIVFSKKKIQISCIDHLQLKTSISKYIINLHNKTQYYVLYLFEMKIVIHIFEHTIYSNFYEYVSMTPLFSYRINIIAINMLKIYTRLHIIKLLALRVQHV